MTDPEIRVTRLGLTAAVFLGGVVLFLVFYAAAEPGRLRGIAERETAEKAARREAMLPLAEVIFIAHCSECHGTAGEGTQKGPTLNSRSFLDAAPDEAIGETIRGGRPGTDMKPWGKERGGPFGNDEVEGLVAFIRSWQASAPSGADDPRLARPSAAGDQGP